MREREVMRIIEVLLVDGWHKVNGESFRCVDEDSLVGGKAFSFDERLIDNRGIVTVYGPITSVFAVRGQMSSDWPEAIPSSGSGVVGGISGLYGPPGR